MNLRWFCAFALCATSACADGFTTAAEVRPILTATRPAWIAVREYEGRDLLYFTNLLAWRCGLTGVRFAINGSALTPLVAEPCHDGTAQPNALTMEQVLPYVVQPLGSINSVTVEITYDDGQADTASYDRASVLMP